MIDLSYGAFVKFTQTRSIIPRVVYENERGNLDALLNAIKSKHGAKEHPDRIVSLSWPASINVENRLEPTRGVIREKTNYPAREWRDSGAPREFFLLKVRTQKFDCILIGDF